MNRFVQAIVKRYVDRAEFKAFLQTLALDQRRQYLVKIAQCGKRALGQYYRQMAAAPNGGARKGLGEVALVEHITGVVMKLMAKQGEHGAGASGVGLLHQQQLKAREEELARHAASRERLERDRAEHERARTSARGTIGTGGGDISSDAQRRDMRSPHEMAQYWKRLGEMRGAYLPRAKQTMELLRKKNKSSASEVQKRNADRFLQWMSAYLVPVLSQTAETPCETAKFTMAELEQLDAQMKKLIAMTSGRSAAPQGSAASGAASGGFASREQKGVARATAGVVESDCTSESLVGTDVLGSKREREDEPSRGVYAMDPEEALRNARAKASAEAFRKAAEDAERCSMFSYVTSGRGEFSSSDRRASPPTPFALEGLNKRTPNGSSVSNDSEDVPTVFESTSGMAVALSFVNGGRELRRRALEERLGATEAVSAAAVWETLKPTSR